MKNLISIIILILLTYGCSILVTQDCIDLVWDFDTKSMTLNNKQFTGKCVVYLKDGKKYEQKTYKKGLVSGVQYGYWYPSEKLKYKGYIKNGEINGRFIEYYENGNISQKGKMKNGRYDGKWRIFYENGNKKEDVLYKDGIILRNKVYENNL